MREDRYPTTNTMNTTVRNPSPGILAGFPWASNLIISGNQHPQNIGQYIIHKIEQGYNRPGGDHNGCQNYQSLEKVIDQLARSERFH